MQLTSFYPINKNLDIKKSRSDFYHATTAVTWVIDFCAFIPNIITLKNVKNCEQKGRGVICENNHG